MDRIFFCFKSDSSQYRVIGFFRIMNYWGKSATVKCATPNDTYLQKINQTNLIMCGVYGFSILL